MFKNLPTTQELVVNKVGAKLSIDKIAYTPMDFVRELFGNMNDKITNVKINLIENEGYYLNLWWDDGGCDTNDKNNLTQLCKTSEKLTAGNNGLGIRNAMKSVIPDKQSSIVITKYNNKIDFLVLEGIWKSSKWTKTDLFRENEYNNISNNTDGTLWIFPLRKKVYEEFNSKNIKKVIKRLVCKKILNGVNFYFNNKKLEINNYIIPKQILKSNNTLNLKLEMGNIKIKTNNVVNNSYAFKILNHKDIIKNKRFEKIPELINLSNFNKSINRNIEKIIDAFQSIIKNSYNKIEGSECEIELTNVFNNGMVIDKSSAEKNKEKLNKKYNEITEEYGDITGINLCLNDIFILEKPLLTDLGNSEGSGCLGAINRLVGIVNIKSSKNKDFYYTTPSDKHTSRTNNNGKKLHQFLGYTLYKSIFNPNKKRKESQKETIKRLKEEKKVLVLKAQKDQELKNKAILKAKKVKKKLELKSKDNKEIIKKLSVTINKYDNLESSTQSIKDENKKLKLENSKYIKDAIPNKLQYQVWLRDFGNVAIGECPICKDQLTKFPGVLGTPSCSHIIPQKKGGPMILDNLIYLCSTCNSKCGQSDMRTFVKERYPKIEKEFFEKFNKQFNKLNNRKLKCI